MARSPLNSIQATSTPPAWLKPIVIGGVILTLVALEQKRPLRSQVENKFRHDLRNLTIAALSALTIRLTEKPLTDRAAGWVEKYRIGLLPRLGLPPLLNAAVAVGLLDYTLYLWHILTHKWSFLWRFHEVHHEDLDLTATTAVRFHFAEMGISALWRAAQVLMIGTSAKVLNIWQTLTLLEILFHHSNIKLNPRTEKILSHLIVTPRMHAIHHSVVEAETSSNWSSGLTVWDWLHGTLRLDVPQNQIKIGVPAYGSDRDVALLSLIRKPFREQRKSWHPAVPLLISRSRSDDPFRLDESTPYKKEA